MIWWLKGLWLLRKPELVRALGDMQLSIVELDRIRRAMPAATIDKDVLVQGWTGGNLQLGNGVRMAKGCIVALGDEPNGYGNLVVGEKTWIGQYNNFRLSSGANITVGRRCLISQFCNLVAVNHGLDRNLPIANAPADKRRFGVTLGDDVWLGAGCSILPAVIVGTGAVIGANSVVSKSVPPYEVWAGVPAAKIGERKAGSG